MYYSKKAVKYSHKKVVNFYVVYEITNFRGIDNYPTLGNALFGPVKLTKNADIDKYRYFGYGIRFDGKGFYSHPSSGSFIHTLVVELKKCNNFWSRYELVCSC